MTQGAFASSGLGPLLQYALSVVEGQWATLRADAFSAEEVSGVAGDLARAVATAFDAHDGPVPSVSHPQLARRTIARLRSEFVMAVARKAEVDLPAVLQCLQAFEQVAESLEPGWDKQFTERLSGPNGLDLVVEIAHDLRSPLTSILFLAETLLRGRSGVVSPLQERQLGLIYSAAFGLSSVASDVIELARGGDRLLEAEPVPFSIADAIESVRDIVLPIAEEKGLALEITALPMSLRLGYPSAVSRVLLNLTTNAWKFTDTGRVAVSAAAVDATLVEFAVQDTGRGIPEDAIISLFEPFRRRQKRDYAFSGSGLGLSICRKLVQAMGGELGVTTGQGAGTRFSFTLRLPVVDQGDLIGGRNG